MLSTGMISGDIDRREGLTLLRPVIEGLNPGRGSTVIFNIGQRVSCTVGGVTTFITDERTMNLIMTVSLMERKEASVLRGLEMMRLFKIWRVFWVYPEKESGGAVYVYGSS